MAVGDKKGYLTYKDILGFEGCLECLASFKNIEISRGDEIGSRLVVTNEEFLNKAYEFVKKAKNNGYKGKFNIVCDWYDVISSEFFKTPIQNVSFNRENVPSEVARFKKCVNDKTKPLKEQVISREELASACIRIAKQCSRLQLIKDFYGIDSNNNYYLCDILRLGGLLALPQPYDRSVIHVYCTNNGFVSVLTKPMAIDLSFEIRTGAVVQQYVRDYKKDSNLLRTILNLEESKDMFQVFSNIINSVQDSYEQFIVAEDVCNYLLEVILSFPSDLLVMQEGLGAGLGTKCFGIDVILLRIELLCELLCESKRRGIKEKEGIRLSLVRDEEDYYF